MLLVRDYGPLGWVAFAVPNVIGAAAMGWVLTRETSASVTASHRTACAVFSIVTIAFQISFLTTMLPRLGDVLPGGLEHRVSAVAIALAGIVAGVATAAGFAARWVAASIWVASAVSLVAVVAQTGWPELPRRGERPGLDLISLAPVMAFGFLLCPYLDLTFHRARQEAGRDGRLAFGLGFGVLFLLMIAGTLLYFGPALAWLRERRVPEHALAIPLGVHLLGQLTVTIAYHADCFDRVFSRVRSARLAGMSVGVGLLIAASLGLRSGDFGVDLSAREVVYRVFMAFYGLVFPAYVWICMIPVRGEDASRPPGRRRLLVLAAACLLAAPFYWWGFIRRETVWLVPGLAILLLARLFVRNAKGAPS